MVHLENLKPENWSLENVDWSLALFSLLVIAVLVVTTAVVTKLPFKARQWVIGSGFILTAVVGTGWVYLWSLAAPYDGVRDVRLSAFIVVCAADMLLAAILVTGLMISSALRGSKK